MSRSELAYALGFVLLSALLLRIAPDTALGPYGAINPQSMVRLVVLLTAISFAGSVAERLVGPRYGLALIGLLGGFISSTATIVAMGLRAREGAASWQGAASGALASNVATVVLYPLMMAAVDPSLLESLTRPLLLSGTAAVLSALALFWYGRDQAPVEPEGSGQSFKPWLALGVLLLVGLISLLSAALQEKLGSASIVVISGAAALVDAHSAAGSVANLYHSGAIDAETARLSVVTALSMNSVTKIVMALGARHRAYSMTVVAGIVLMVSAAWLGLLLS